MSTSLIVTGLGAAVAMAATGLLAARCLRAPRAFLVSWTLACFALAIALGAQLLGYQTGYSSVTFRAMELAAQLLAPVALCLGLAELAGRSLPARFAVRLLLSVLTIIAVVILGIDPLNASASFSKQWPDPFYYYQLVPAYLIEYLLAPVTTVIALAAALVTAVRSRRDPGARARLAAVAAAAAAVLSLAALGLAELGTRYHLLTGTIPARQVFAASCGLAAALAWFAGMRATRVGTPPRADRDDAADDADWESRLYRDRRGPGADSPGALTAGGHGRHAGSARYGLEDDRQASGYQPPGADRDEGVGYAVPAGYGTGSPAGYGTGSPAGYGTGTHSEAGRYAGPGGYGEPGGYAGPGGYGEPGRYAGAAGDGEPGSSGSSGYGEAGPPAGTGRHGGPGSYGEPGPSAATGPLPADDYGEADQYPATADPIAGLPGGAGAPDRFARRHGYSSLASSQPHAQLFGQIAIYTLLEDRVEEFDRLTERVVADVRAREPDTLVYIVHAVPTAPMQRILYEVYRDRAAYEQHRRQPYVARFEVERRPLVLATNVIELGLQQAKVSPFPSISDIFDQTGINPAQVAGPPPAEADEAAGYPVPSARASHARPSGRGQRRGADAREYR